MHLNTHLALDSTLWECMAERVRISFFYVHIDHISFTNISETKHLQDFCTSKWFVDKFVSQPKISIFDETALVVFAARLDGGKKTNFVVRQKVDGTSRPLQRSFCPKVSRALECKEF